MEIQTCHAFITTPNFTTPQISETQQTSSQNLRPKIILILKSFNDKQILAQAVKNITVPKHFTDIEYVQSRPDSQLPKIYTIVTALKKQVKKIKNTSSSQQIKNPFLIESSKPNQYNPARYKQNQSKQKNYQFLNKQISPQTKIRQAIIKQLQDRQKLQTKIQRMDAATKIKSQFLQKRKETAKLMNKKANQLYQKQKEIQHQQFQKIFENTLQANNKDNLQESFIKDFSVTTKTIERDHNHQMVKKRLQNSKLQFQNYLSQQINQRIQKEKSFKDFKHRRLNSLNQRILMHRVKSQEVLQRKIATANEQENRKLNNFLNKQIKFMQQKKNSPNQENKGSQMTETYTLNGSSFFRVHQTRSVDFQKQNEKQNMIFDKLERKNELKKLLLEEKVSKIRQKNKIKEEKREAFKESQMKFITQADNDESFVYQNNFLSTKDSFVAKNEVSDVQEVNIKNKHLKVLKGLECEENLMRLRKLPKSALLKYLQQVKQKTLGDKEQTTQ